MRGAALPILLLAVWETASHTGLVHPSILPPLEVVAAGAWDPRLPGDIAASLSRDLAGFACGSLGGVLFGGLLGISRIAERLLLPAFDFTKQIAIFAWIPLPAILTGLQLALIYAWLATIGAEYFMTAGPGIGGLIIDGRERFQMSEVMLGVVLLGAIGFLFARIAAVLESRLLHWRQA